MALTITLDDRFPQRISRSLGILTGVIAFDSSYPTGGELASGITKFFKSCHRLICDAKGGYVFEWDKANGKIKVIAPVNVIASTGVADANNTVMKSASATLEVAGTGTAFQQPGVEVLDTTDLSGLTGVSFIAIGEL